MGICRFLLSLAVCTSCVSPVIAAGNAVGEALWEPQGIPVVRVEENLGLHDMGEVVAAFDEAEPVLRGIDIDCGDYCVRPINPDFPHVPPQAPAPVPLPFSGFLLAAALGLLWKWRRI